MPKRRSYFPMSLKWANLKLSSWSTKSEAYAPVLGTHIESYTLQKEDSTMFRNKHWLRRGFWIRYGSHLSSQMKIQIRKKEQNSKLNINTLSTLTYPQTISTPSTNKQTPSQGYISIECKKIEGTPETLLARPHNPDFVSEGHYATMIIVLSTITCNTKHDWKENEIGSIGRRPIQR